MSTRYSKPVVDTSESKSPEEVKRTRLTKAGDHKALFQDLFSGTGWIAELGAVLLAAFIWKAVLTHNFNLFSFHPLMNSLALFIAVQSTLVLQPTHTDTERYRGTWAHFLLNVVAALSLLTGLSVIETIKATRPETRFRTLHSYLGMATYLAILSQAVVGVVQFFAPRLVGGERNAQKLYAWHRLLGYMTLSLSLLTVIAATRTSYNLRVLHISTNGVVGSVALLLLGLVCRIERAKLPGWNDKPRRAKLK